MSLTGGYKEQKLLPRQTAPQACGHGSVVSGNAIFSPDFPAIMQYKGDRESAPMIHVACVLTYGARIMSYEAQVTFGDPPTDRYCSLRATSNSAGRLLGTMTRLNTSHALVSG